MSDIVSIMTLFKLFNTRNHAALLREPLTPYHMLHVGDHHPHSLMSGEIYHRAFYHRCPATLPSEPSSTIRATLKRNPPDP